MATATQITPETVSECECDWFDTDQSEHSGDEDRQVHHTDFDEVDAPFDDEQLEEAGAELIKQQPVHAARARSSRVRKPRVKLPDVLRPEPDTDDDAKGPEGGLSPREDARARRA
jgi:hypothetical protein